MGNDSVDRDEFVVRRYERSMDLDQVRDLVIASMRELTGHLHTAEALDRHDAHVRSADFAAGLDGVDYLVAYSVDGEMAGVGGWCFDPDPTSARIREVFVHPRWVRRGIATMLVDTAIGRARAAGATRIWVQSSVIAMPLYAELGFVATSSVSEDALPSARMELASDSCRGRFLRAGRHAGS